MMSEYEIDAYVAELMIDADKGLMSGDVVDDRYEMNVRPDQQRYQKHMHYPQKNQTDDDNRNAEQSDHVQVKNQKLGRMHYEISLEIVYDLDHDVDDGKHVRQIWNVLFHHTDQ